MADLQITGLNRLVEADINQADELAVADVSATETKKVTVKDLVNAVVTATGTSFLADGAIPGSKIGTLGTGLVDTGTIIDNKVTNVKIETSTSATTGIDGSQKLRDGSVPVVKLDASKFDRGLSVVASKLGIGNSITAGTKSGITYTAQGLISGVADLVATDLPVGTASAIGAVKVESGSLLEVSNTGAIDVKNVSGLSAGTYASVTVNAKGQVTAGSTSATATTIPAATTSAKGGVIVPTSGGMAVDGSGNLSIATQASVNAGDYAKVTVNTKGIVTGTGTLAAADIPDHSAAKLTSGTIPAARIGSSAINASRIDTGAVTNDKVETSTNSSTGLDGSTKLRDGTITAAKLNTSNIDRSLNVAGGNLGINNAVTGGAATRSGITYNVQGLITGTAALGASDLPLATSSAVGGISVGSGLSVNGSGVLSLSNSVTAATVSGITFSSSGQITSATALVAGDLPTATTSAKGAVQITSNGGLTVDGSGNLSTSTSGVNAGTYQSVTVDSKGVVTSGASLGASNIPDLSAAKITSGTLNAARIGADTIDSSKLSNSSTTIIQSIAQLGYPTAAFTGQLLFDPIAEDAFLWDGNAWNAITTLTKGALQRFGTYNASTSKVDYVTAAGAAAGLTVGQNLPVASESVDGGYVVISVQGTPSGIAGITGQLSPPDYLLGVTASASSSSWVEIDLSTTVASQQASSISYTPHGQLSSTNVQAALNEIEDEKLAKAGGTVTGELLIGNTGSFVFEGSTVDAFETRLTVADPTTSDKVITLPNITGTVITTGDTNTVTKDMVDGSLINTNLAANAAIAFTKLEDLTAAKILVGNASDKAAAVTVTGDISINNAGLTSIAAGAIVNADINSSAAISGSKIVAGTTSVVGVVQLVDSTTSTSTTLAATGASVKAAKDAADSAQTTASAAVAKSGSTMTGNLIIDNAKELRLSEADSDGAHFTGFKAQAQSADITYTLPATAPTTGQVLKSGSTATTLEWATDSANAGGSNTQVQFNNSGAFAGSASLTFNSGTGALTATSFVGNVTGDLSGTASSLTVTANNTTDETVYLLFADGATGSQGAESDTGLTYNPSTGLLTSTGFSGSGASLTSLNASNLGSGTVATARLGTGTASSSNYLRGDGTWQAVPSGTTINSNTDNYLITGTGTANTLQGQSNLTYDNDHLIQTIDSDGEGFNQTSASNLYIDNVANTNRTVANAVIWRQTVQWNGTEITSIKSHAGADTTNKDDGYLTFWTSSAANSSERIRLDSAGRLLVGLTDGSQSTQDGNLQINQSACIRRHVASAGAGTLRFEKTRAATDTNTVVQNGDNLGEIFWYGADGNSYELAAGISASVDAAPGDGDMPGRLSFGTTPDGAAGLTTRMVITNSGNIGIGTTSPSSLLTVSGATPQIRSVDTDAANDYSTFQNSSGQSVYNAVDNNTHGKHLFQTAGTERFRFGESGQLGIAGANYGTSGQVLTSGGASAAPTWADAGGASEITANASGSVTAGKTMCINSNGTTSQITDTTQIRTKPAFGNGTSTDGGGYSNSRSWDMAYDSANNVLVRVMRPSNGDIICNAGTPNADNTVTWGNDVSVNNDGASTGCHVAFVGSGKFCCTYRDHTSTNSRARGRMISVSNNTCTVGSERNMYDGEEYSSNYTRCVYHTQQDRFYVLTERSSKLMYSSCVVDQSSNNSWDSDWRAKTVGGSGSNASGLALNGNSTARMDPGDVNGFRGRNMVYDPDSQRVHIIYESTNDDKVRIQSVDALSSTGFNTSQIVHNGHPDNYSNLFIDYDTTTNRVVMMYQVSNVVYARTASWNSSNTNFDFGAEITVYSGAANHNTNMRCVDSGCVVFFYTLVTVDDLKCVIGTINNSDGAITLGTVGGLGDNEDSNGSVLSCIYDSNQGHVVYWRGNNPCIYDKLDFKEVLTTSEGYVGIANNSAADGQSVTIRTFGSTNSNQSSLTPGSVYYIQKNGTLSTTADTPSVVAGVALSATSILVRS